MLLLFDVSASNYAPFFGGQICFKEAIMLVKYATLWFKEKSATLWLFTLPLSPCKLYDVSFTCHFRLIYLARVAFFFYRVHNVVFTACMYACMHACKVYICVHTTPRHIPHFLSRMVRSINTIFQDNTGQYVMLCCRCQKVEFPRP